MVAVTVGVQQWAGPIQHVTLNRSAAKRLSPTRTMSDLEFQPIYEELKRISFRPLECQAGGT